MADLERKHLQATTPVERFEQLDSLLNMASLFFSKKMADKETRQARDIWNQLRNLGNR